MSTDTRRFAKQVQIKATDSAAQRATGVVLTPWEVDTQRDFLRPKGIRNVHTTDPENGVMHSAFPDDAANLERNEVLDADATIDGEAFGAGEWVITREYTDDDLWGLVEDGVLNGFSIGGRITADYEYAAEELPGKVRFPDGVESGGATEIRDGRVEEISDVDIPAVPAAEYSTVKQRGVGKTVFHDADGEDEFAELMEDRGHAEGDARRLYDYLDRHAKAATNDDMTDLDPDDGGDEPDDATKWRRFTAWLSGDGSGGPDDGTDAVEIPEVPLGGDVETALSKARDADKEGRTLNQENQQSLMAAHDAVEAALAEELDFDSNRFTDDPFTDFDVADYAKAADTADTTEKDSDMTDNDEDPPEWATGLTETVEQIEKRVDDLEDDGEDGDDTEKGGDGDEGDGRPEWADELAKTVEELDERLDTVAKATAESGQLDGAGDDDAVTAKRAAIEKEKEVFTR